MSTVITEHANAARRPPGLRRVQHRRHRGPARRLFHEDSCWHTPGRSPLGGSFQGRDAVFGHFGSYGGLTAGTFQANLQDVVTNEDGTVSGSTRTRRRRTARPSTSAAASSSRSRTARSSTGASTSSTCTPGTSSGRRGLTWIGSEFGAVPHQGACSPRTSSRLMASMMSLADAIRRVQAAARPGRSPITREARGHPSNASAPRPLPTGVGRRCGRDLLQ